MNKYQRRRIWPPGLPPFGSWYTSDWPNSTPKRLMAETDLYEFSSAPFKNGQRDQFGVAALKE